MKILIVFSILLAFALGLAQGQYKAAYIPLSDQISNEPSPAIIDGSYAARNQFPYQISLQLQVVINTFRHICGGSIISANWILTAAHCTVKFTPSRLRVVAGILLLNDTDIAGQQTRNVHTIINHPSYPGRNQPAANDIALIRLSTPLSWVENVQLIGVPAEGRTSLGDGTLSGWGLVQPDGETPKHLQFAELPIVPEIQCYRQLSGFLGRDNPFSIQLNLCSGTVRGHESACSGDSGGPYVQDGKVIGVVSWGLTPCGAAGAPSIYTKVSAYTTWITTNTKGEVGA